MGKVTFGAEMCGKPDCDMPHATIDIEIVSTAGKKQTVHFRTLEAFDKAEIEEAVNYFHHILCESKKNNYVNYPGGLPLGQADDH